MLSKRQFISVIEYAADRTEPLPKTLDPDTTDGQAFLHRMPLQDRLNLEACRRLLHEQQEEFPDGDGVSGSITLWWNDDLYKKKLCPSTLSFLQSQV